MAKQIQPVVKPYLRGSWHGRDAVRKGVRMILSVLFVSILYLILGLLLNFNSLALRVITSGILVVTAALYMYFQGANSGEADTAFAEIMAQHEQDGKTVVQGDLERCFHPAKGFFEVLIALLPYLAVTLVFAFLAQRITYSLGVLPSWVAAPAQQTHVGEALEYYNVFNTSIFMAVLRIVSRAVTMPFISVFLLFGTDGVLWAERLTPLWVCLAPLAYGFGYLQGPKLRIKVNTGIKIGISKKKRKERKERKARSAGSKPEQLI
jgi:hypothetical protein